MIFIYIYIYIYIYILLDLSLSIIQESPIVQSKMQIYKLLDNLHRWFIYSGEDFMLSQPHFLDELITEDWDPTEPNNIYTHCLLQLNQIWQHSVFFFPYLCILIINIKEVFSCCWWWWWWWCINLLTAHSSL